MSLALGTVPPNSGGNHFERELTTLLREYFKDGALLVASRQLEHAHRDEQEVWQTIVDLLQEEEGRP